MSCPFPGMDPWLEAPQRWPGFHDTLVIKTMEVLQPQLRLRGYYAEPGQRVWLSQADHLIIPDIVVAPRRREPSVRGSTMAAVLDADEPLKVARTEIEVHENFLNIHQADDHRLVTCIEFISPTNKVHPKGRKLYQRKQRKLKSDGVHLVEIDLLRGGRHVADVPLWVLKPFQPWNYLVSLERRGGADFEFYVFTVRQSLPKVRVPLKATDADAVLDLQDVFTRSYEISPYPDRLDYSQPPDPPLSGDDAAWARQLLTEKGLL